MLPTLRQLEYVVAVAETRQFVAAAKKCAVSQPALSKQIRQVEEILGVTLFERARPGVLVTPAGTHIVQRARRLLADAHELVAFAKTSTRARQGTVRLGVIPTIAPYGLPGLIAKLRAQLPEVSFVIQELQTEVLLERMRAGTLDLGLLARVFDDQGLSGLDLVMEPFVFIATDDHPLAQPEPIAARDIAGTRLLLMEDGHCLRDQAIDVCAAVATPATSISAASVSTLVRMVESGLGPTLLPASALATELRPGQGLVARCFKGTQPGRTLTLQWRATSPNASWFGEIGAVLRQHYLDLNATIPTLSGQIPRIRSLDSEG
ncbi:MAG: hydrogen peroxide-inducible genes activator [Nannocystaceae bacterium]